MAGRKGAISFQGRQTSGSLCDRSDHLERLSQRLKVCRFLALQFCPDLFKAPYGLLRIETLSTMEADLGTHPQDGGVNPTTQEFLDLFLHEFATANWAFVKGHLSVFSRQNCVMKPIFIIAYLNTDGTERSPHRREFPHKKSRRDLHGIP
jgi:hypothetical protein